MKNKRKGFTLIELLVVIAIIGILSAIILVVLSTARGKANDSKIKSQLTDMRNNGEVYYGNQNNYGSDNAVGDNVCSVTSSDTTGLYLLEQPSSYPGGVVPTCTTDADGSDPATMWSAYSTLSDGSIFCVDNTGQAKSYDYPPASNGWVAPTTGTPCP